jgi:hypothetical protein
VSRGHLLGHFGWNEPGAQRPFGGAAGDRDDVRQHAIEPRHEPLGTLCKQALHIDRNVQCRAV